MEELQNNLDQQLEHLAMLTRVLEQEQLALCAGRIQTGVLQQVTEQKSLLLASLASLEHSRLATETVASVVAPYQQHSALAERWQKRQQLAEQLHDNNLHNSLLLNQHIDHNNQALALLSAHHRRTALYGPDGQSRGTSLSGRKIGI